MLRHPCILGDPQRQQRGAKIQNWSQTKGNKIRSAYLTPAFSGAQKSYITPAFSGDIQDECLGLGTGSRPHWLQDNRL